jgi:hypothetical protein
MSITQITQKTLIAVTVCFGWFGFSASLKAQVSYQAILNVGDSVTGVRGSTTDPTNPNIVYTGNSPGNGLLYIGNLNGTGTSYVLNAFGGVNTTNTLLYGPDTYAFNPIIGADNIRAVGTYNTLTNGSQVFGALYTGPATGGGTWSNIQVPDSVAGGTVSDTIPHSVMGDLVVGNYNIPSGTNATPGSAFIYNIRSSSYSLVNLPGGATTSLYGIWQNGIGSDSYTLVGGTASVAGLNQGLIMNYNSLTLEFSNITRFAIGSTNIETHFEGISGVAGGYSVVGMTLNGGVGLGEYYGVIATNNDGTFNTDTAWTSIYYPGSDSTTVNTVYGTNAIGVFINSGAGGERPYVATVGAIPEPSTYALFGLGALALVVAYRRKVA